MNKIKFNNPPWIPIIETRQLKALNKFHEELHEVGKVISRIGLQGIDGIDPASGQNNKEMLEKELGDMHAFMSFLVVIYNLNTSDIETQMAKKIKSHSEWIDS